MLTHFKMISKREKSNRNSSLEPVFTLQPIKSKKGIRTIEIERPFNRGYLLSLRSGSSTR